MRHAHRQVCQVSAVQPAASPAIPIPVSLAACHAAWLKARRGKRPSANQLAFDARWLDRLLELNTALRVGAWQPARTVSFVVNHPKTREIHAPDFAGRVVHHLLVERLEPLYEPIFIHDSYANRLGKGSHTAVERLQAFLRQMNGRGWFLQLDIHNYFNSIHRSTLYGLLKARIGKASCSAGVMSRGDGILQGLARTPASGQPGDATRSGAAESPEGQSDGRGRQGCLRYADALALQSLCHKLLANPIREHVSDPAAAARIPPHKRLANAAPGCGLPVGNLTSQFFANVYLNELDQFVKHRLKCRRYLRYVDDFVLLADTREQLLAWQAQIETFLASALRLKLKDDVRIGPLSQGVDFLGYRVFPGHRLVRPRVLRHCRAGIEAWARRHVRATAQGLRIRADAPALASLQAMLGSYWGHFKHANSARLRRALFARHPWLALLFDLDAPACTVCLTEREGEVQPAPSPRSGKGRKFAPARIVLIPRWVLQGETHARQAEAFMREWPRVWCLLQKGNRWGVLPAPAHLTPRWVAALQADLRRRGIPYVRAAQTGWLRHGTRRREIVEWFVPAP